MFTPGSTSPMLLDGLPRSQIQDCHLLWSTFPGGSLVCGFVPVRSPLLGESRLLSFPLATKMFQFTRFASIPYTFRYGYPFGWVSPFGHLRIDACLPAPRSLSQATTSFIASQRQGIHHTLLIACSLRPPADPSRPDARTCQARLRALTKELGITLACNTKDLSTCQRAANPAAWPPPAMPRAGGPTFVGTPALGVAHFIQARVSCFP
jgi:hypothetical protein